MAGPIMDARTTADHFLTGASTTAASETAIATIGAALTDAAETAISTATASTADDANQSSRFAVT